MRWTGKLLVALAVTILASTAAFAAGATGWAVVTNVSDATINTVDLSTNTVYGPFLAGQLGSTEGELLDAVAVPGGRYALVSNFGDEMIYRIDLADPQNPVLAGSVSVPFYAEDIAVAPNGAFAIAVSNSSTGMASIDLGTFTLQATYYLHSGGAAAVAIAPDSQTVVVADTYGNKIIYGVFNPATGFVSENALGTGSGPLNVAISPDGKTVLTPNVFDNTVSAFSITAPGTLSAGSTVSGLPTYPQTVVFSTDGTRAFVLSASCSDEVSWLNVTGPGSISLGGAGVATLPAFCGSTYYGVDQMDVSPDGSTLVIGDGGGGGGDLKGLLAGGATTAGAHRDAQPHAVLPSTSVALVSTTDFSVAYVPTGGYYPTGVAILGSGFDASFFDDYSRSQFCVSTKTGAYQWTILVGPKAGMYTGTCRVLNGGARFTSMAGDANTLSFIYDPVKHKAAGYYITGGYYSRLQDANTLNDPAGCNAQPQQTLK